MTLRRAFLFTIMAIVAAIVLLSQWSGATVVETRQYLNVETSFDSVWVLGTPRLGGDFVPINAAQDEDTLHGDTSGWYSLFFEDSTNYVTTALFFKNGIISGASNGYVDLQDTIDIKTLAGNNPSLFYGPTASGSGSNDWFIFVADTSTPGDTILISHAKITIRTLAGTVDGVLRTNTSGYEDFTVDLSAFTVQVTKPGSGLDDGPLDTITVASHGQIDTIWTTMTGLPASGAPGLATLFLTYYNGADPVKGAKLVVRNDNVATDSTQDVLIGPFIDSDKTDSLGRASIFVPKSYLYHDSTLARYDITLIRRGRIVASWSDYWIADQDTIRLIVR